MASRILGMGDVLTLIEKAQAEMDDEKAAEMEKRFRKAEFTFNDYLDSMSQMKRWAFCECPEYDAGNWRRTDEAD